MGLIDINIMFESVKEIPLYCPQCNGELVAIKLLLADQLKAVFYKDRMKLHRLRCKECLNEINVAATNKKNSAQI